MKPSFTIGIEEEYQTIDPETRDLRSHIHSEIIAKGKRIMEEQIKAEMHQSVVEVGTGVCKNIKEAKKDIRKLRHDMIKLAQARYFLPHLLALSANSPFWLGMNTGLKSYRCKVFDKFPRTNIPNSYSSWSEYENFVNLLIKTNCIDNAKKIWWDIRPHPFFNTLEFRVCDIPMRLEETIALAALIQATIAKLYRLHSRNQGFRIYGRALLMENKWRAARYGLDGKLIDFGIEAEVNERDLIYEYLEFVDDVLDELDSREEINYIHRILEMGNGADRQLKAFEETGDLKKVVDYMVEETKVGVFDTETASVTH
ncbi:MAG: carboxylate-amine ligase [Acidobacteria bacterium]|nr:MAG: carboxylate-amine ligase [Acidobacteriota bacterium]